MQFLVECRSNLLCGWFEQKLASLSHVSSNQKLSRKTTVGCSHAFSRVFASSSDWLIGPFASVVTGQSNYFGFGFLLKTALKQWP